MVYTSDDPIIAKQLEEMGCVAVMPLASLIGSGMGILNPWNLQIIIENAKVPVLVDAGVGTASDAAIAMELGCDGVLMNTAIAAAKDPVLMARAMKKGVEAGREAFLAGRMPKKLYSARPLPTAGLITPAAAETTSHRATSTHRAIRSFVLRQGRVSNAQRRAHDELLPQFGVPYLPGALDLGRAFRRAHREYSRSASAWARPPPPIAAAHPENDYLAIEVHTPGVGSLLKRIAEDGLANLRMIQHDAVEVLEHMIATATFDGAHIFFPDPWPKKRHHKRRLIQPAFVALLASRLKPGGYVHAATDWEEYAQQILEVFSAEPALNEYRRRLRTASRLPPADQVRAARTEARPRGVGYRLSAGVEPPHPNPPLRRGETLPPGGTSPSGEGHLNCTVSLELDVRFADQLAPLGALAVHEAAELLRRARDGLDAEHGELVFHFLHRERFGEIRRHLVDDRPRHAGREQDAPPVRRVESLEPLFGERRQLRRERRALLARHRQARSLPLLIFGMAGAASAITMLIWLPMSSVIHCAPPL